MNILGDQRPEILYGAHDGHVYCISPDAELLWRVNITHGRALMYASEIMVADLDRDGRPQIVFTTFGDPDSLAPGKPHGYLMILDREGTVLMALHSHPAPVGLAGCSKRPICCVALTPRHCDVLLTRFR